MNNATSTDNVLAAGLRLLTRKDRQLHPRGQVQKLRRIAVRALNDADFREGIPTPSYPEPPQRFDFSDTESEQIAAKRARAAAALAAMQYLNREHNLGY